MQTIEFFSSRASPSSMPLPVHSSPTRPLVRPNRNVRPHGSQDAAVPRRKECVPSQKLLSELLFYQSLLLCPRSLKTSRLHTKTCCRSSGSRATSKTTSSRSTFPATTSPSPLPAYRRRLHLDLVDGSR